MSDNEPVSEFLELEEKRLMEAMQKKAQSRAKSNLGDPLIMREAENKKAVASIFEKMREGKIPEAPVTAPTVVANRLDEKAEELTEKVAPGSWGSIMDPDNDGSHNYSGARAPHTTVEPKERFRGDKPKGATIPLPARKPDPNEKQDPLKMHAKPEPKSVKENEFNLDVKFEEKLEEGKHDIPTDSLTNPKVKDAVGKLRAMAAELRGEAVAQPDKPLVVKPADTPHGQLMENVEEPSYTLKKLNSMLYRAQDRFNQTDNPVYESIADELSSAIAEALLQNKKVVPKSKISGPARNF